MYTFSKYLYGMRIQITAEEMEESMEGWTDGSH